MTKDEALDLALEALESCTPADTSTGHVVWPSYDEQAVKQAITAIKQARSAPVQEPYARIYETEGPFGLHQSLNCRPYNGRNPDRVVPVYTTPPAQPAPVQPFDHKQAANTALRESMNRSVAIAKNTVPTLQKRPPNCGTGYCSCVECVVEPAAQPAPVQDLPFGVGGGLVAIKTLLSCDPCVHANTAIEMIDAILKEHPAAQRQWVGLTQEERLHFLNEILDYGTGFVSPLDALICNIEAKLKEKNNG
jgi:hypothetical protein